MVEKMYVSYKIMCMKGKPEVEACKSIIQCFMGTLAKWWETESSPALLEKMEKETLEDENGNIIFIEDRFAQNNMIGALTTMILEHWWGIEQKIANKHSIIMMNMKYERMLHCDEFHKEWLQRIYKIKDNTNALWKHIYLVALPIKFVENCARCL